MAALDSLQATGRNFSIRVILQPCHLEYKGSGPVNEKQSAILNPFGCFPLTRGGHQHGRKEGA